MLYISYDTRLAPHVIHDLLILISSYLLYKPEISGTYSLFGDIPINISYERNTHLCIKTITKPRADSLLHLTSVRHFKRHTAQSLTA